MRADESGAADHHKARPFEVQGSSPLAADRFGHEPRSARPDETADIPSGAAYIYARTNSVWTNTARLTPDGNEAYGSFGQSVAINANRALVGAPQASGISSHSGTAWIYQLNGAIWQAQSRLQADTDRAKSAGKDTAGAQWDLDNMKAAISAGS